MGLFLSAEVGVLLGEQRQPLFQSGVEGVDACRIFALVEQNDGFLFILRQLRYNRPPYRNC